MAGVLNSSAARWAVPAMSKMKDASRDATNPTALVPNASPPAPKRACVASLILCALDVRPVLGHHNDSRTRADVWRHGSAHTVGQDSRLVGRRRGLSLGDGLGFHYFQRCALRHLDRHRQDAMQ